MSSPRVAAPPRAQGVSSLSRGAGRMQRGFLHGLLACVVLVVAFSHTDRPAHAQSLVDAARLARERREELGPPTKVYTTEDLPDVRRITEPTLAWVSRYRFLLEAALERERARLELLRERSVMLPAPVPMKPVKMVPPDPAPAPPTIEIPLYPVYAGYLVYPGYPALVASRPDPRPRHSTMISAPPRRYRRGGRARESRSRIQTTPRRGTSGRRVDPSTRRPAARNGYEQSSRPFPYIARGLAAPGVARNRPGGRATLP